jgi:hypothetical protein
MVLHHLITISHHARLSLPPLSAAYPSVLQVDISTVPASNIAVDQSLCKAEYGVEVSRFFCLKLLSSAIPAAQLFPRYRGSLQILTSTQLLTLEVSVCV